MYKIVGVYNGRIEEIDSTDSWCNAKYLVRECRMAFGAGWAIYINGAKKELGG